MRWRNRPLVPFFIFPFCPPFVRDFYNMGVKYIEGTENPCVPGSIPGPATAFSMITRRLDVVSGMLTFRLVIFANVLKMVRTECLRN